MNPPSATTVDWAVPDASQPLAMPKKADNSSLFADDQAAASRAADSAAAPADEVSNFETALTELESIVAQMEGGALKLEDSLRLFERGVLLTRQCRQSLETAELKVRNLLANDGDAATPAN